MRSRWPGGGGGARTGGRAVRGLAGRGPALMARACPRGRIGPRGLSLLSASPAPPPAAPLGHVQAWLHAAACAPRPHHGSVGGGRGEHRALEVLATARAGRGGARLDAAPAHAAEGPRRSSHVAVGGPGQVGLSASKSWQGACRLARPMAVAPWHKHDLCGAPISRVRRCAVPPRDHVAQPHALRAASTPRMRARAARSLSQPDNAGRDECRKHPPAGLPERGALRKLHPLGDP